MTYGAERLATDRINRFWSRVETTPGGCMEWTGGRMPHGYGLFIGKLAHRWIYQAIHGVKLSRYEFVLHSCDNPPCVNPAHLRVGTPKDNTADMFTKGRSGLPAAKGERNNKAKMTAGEVIGFRARYAAGESAKAMAIERGVNPSTMHSAATGKTWKHLPMPAPVR